MTTDAARRAVFDTPELLENIISFLPMADILSKAQRISRAWKAVIQSSHSIQVKLWLKPEVQQVLQPFQTVSDPTKVQRGWFSSLVGMPIYTHSVQLNPIMRILKDWKNPVVQQPLEQRIVRLLIRPSEFPLGASGHGKFRFGSSSSQSSISFTKSWERMQLANPPITVVSIEVYYPRTDFSFSVTLSLQDKGGITLGHVYDATVLANSPFGDRERFQHKTWETVVGYLHVGMEKRDTT